jgi:uncharacterized Rossmann fold enzyme
LILSYVTLDIPSEDLHSFPLWKNWYDTFYSSISTSLGYSKESDERSRDELSNLLRQKGIQAFDEQYLSLRSHFKNRNCIIFGAGPSLHDDVMNLYPVARKAKNLVIAADGATDTLLEAMIAPQVTVSDLDSCSEKSLLAQSQQRTLLVHAHGDNIELLRQIVPRLGKNLLGTTQVNPIENVRNIGGFMDGDRACYFATSLDPKIVVIAGMDFIEEAEEGSIKIRMSKLQTNSKLDETKLEKRSLKLDYARRSLEYLIENRRSIKFLNSSSRGTIIRGTETIELPRIIEALS